MKRILAIVLLIIMVTTTAQATTTEMVTHEQIVETLQDQFQQQMQESTIETEGMGILVKYSEKLHSFIIYQMQREMSDKKLMSNVSSVSEFFKNMQADISDLKQQINEIYPNDTIILALGRSEDEVFWVYWELAGIYFLYNNKTGKIYNMSEENEIESINDL